MNKPNLDREIYNKLVRNIEIKSIQLNQLSIHNVDDQLADNCSLSLSLSFDNSNFKVENNNMIVHSKFFVNVKESDEPQSNIAFEMEFTYKLIYYIEDLKEFDLEYIKLFNKRNVPVNIWPYARELISSSSTRIGFPTLIIEPLKI